jgi:hypothetical protein
MDVPKIPVPKIPSPKYQNTRPQNTLVALGHHYEPIGWVVKRKFYCQTSQHLGKVKENGPRTGKIRF